MSSAAPMSRFVIHRLPAHTRIGDQNGWQSAQRFGPHAQVAALVELGTALLHTPG
jgi:hypothetical protein